MNAADIRETEARRRRKEESSVRREGETWG